MKKIKKNTIEFYITNVCNFNCDNCNRLNNYYFSGHESWIDHAHEYQEWSRKIDFKKIIILGGEPTLNPDLPVWVKELRKLWPDARLIINTNGSRLKYWYERDFFNLLSETGTELSIQLHNRNRYQSYVDEIKGYLINPTETYIPYPSVKWEEAYKIVKDPSWPECKNYDDFLNLPDYIQTECREIHKIDFDNFVKDTGSLELVDQRGIKITISYSENFWSAPLRYIGNNKFSVYDSDPDKAHTVCPSKGCTHMMKGKMYKCHHVALLPEFSKQFDVEMKSNQEKLMQSYQPLTSDVDISDMAKFIEKLPNPIPQCNLCPSMLDNFYLQSTTDKPKIKKKIFNIKNSRD